MLTVFLILNFISTFSGWVKFHSCEKMPAGVSWPRYMRMLGASMLAMFAGAQAVHQYYLPDLVSDKKIFTMIQSLQLLWWGVERFTHVITVVV